ncbi:MAG: GMC family oxidoreductase [Acidobacteria bacterium]|nr:GMC family oxidoreductase [Acidobacteriota bacterium]MBV9478105.1 GMC family oxidoreductase [Acidobacteriota bacterium]
MLKYDRHVAEFDYVVVGSGAGGGTVAARLAENGFTVLLLEAGGDPLQMRGTGPAAEPPGQNRLPDDYLVPVFHANAVENEAMRWDFFVRHYRDDALQQRDDKYRATYNGQPVDGVLYPRAGCLGGCTSHNALITVYPHNQNWDEIAALTGDASWSADNMRTYWQRLENCHHRPGWRFLEKLTRWNPTRHGFGGWLHTEAAIPKAALDDGSLKTFIIDTVAACTRELGNSLVERIRWFLLGHGDPNDWRLVRENAVGLRYPPLATHRHVRNGTRERVLAVAKQHPSQLTIELNALATRVLFDDANRAIGVEYRKGARLYRAHAQPSGEEGQLKKVFVKREVILAGGAFNTPQLLMLSGIGPRDELETHGIDVRVELPGVGANLQDRYEVGIVNRMNFKSWWILDDARFAAGDKPYKQWKKRRKGVYTTNGAVAAVIRRSLPERPVPDLFVFALLGKFYGYFPGYSALFPKYRNYLTWCILKAHTRNSAGRVRLRSTDPRDTPLIDFSYFAEGNDRAEEDLRSVVAGIRFVRELTRPLRERGLIEEEERPGEALQSDEALSDYVRYNAWGHHASCTCPIGDRANGGVVNGDFEVHGTRNLRIVDASVFPKIPGFFIVSSVYTIAEKAADVIARAARSEP